MYMSGFIFYVLTAIISDLSMIYPYNRNNSEHAIDRAETETVVHLESQHHRNESRLILKKAASIYFDAQDTFKGALCA